jgi:dihydrofolate reductase
MKNDNNMKRKIILYIASSLDGYIATKSDGLDWLFMDQDYGYSEFIKNIDTVLMGRLTYQLILSFGDYPYKGTEGFVFSRKETRPKDEHVTFVSSDIKTFINDLKNKPGKNIWLVGGGELNRTFLELGLIDEFIISLHPILLGDGLPMFPPSFPQTELIFKNCQSFDSGLVQLTYQLKTKMQ